MVHRGSPRRSAVSSFVAALVAACAAACASKPPQSAAHPPLPGPIVPPLARVETANVVSTGTAAERIYSKAKEAVVKIVVRRNGQPYAFGAGFFVAADGRLVTSRHVVREAIARDGLSLEFQLADGRTTVTRFAVGGCGDERELDLCVLKLDHKPRRWIDAVPTPARPGERSFVIGHPEGFEYTFSDGIISAVRRLEYGVNYVQFTASISQGNSGGPVLDERGRLLGIATKFSVEGQNLNFAIATSEIASYLRKYARFMPLAAYLREEAAALVEGLGRNPMRKWFPPTDPRSIEGAKRNLKLGDPVTYQFPVAEDTVFLPAPSGLFEGCAPTDDAGSRAARCFDKRTRTALVVATLPIRGKPVLSQSGQLPETPRVHEFDPKAPDSRPGASLPLPWSCRRAKEFAKSSLAGRGDGACFAMVKNNGRSGAFKLLAEAESLGRVYSFVLTSEEPRLINYAQAWLWFAVSNAVSAGMARSPAELRGPAAVLGRPAWPFQVDLPARYKEFEFIRSRGGGTYLAKASKPPYSVAITPLRPGVPPQERRAFQDGMLTAETQSVVGAPGAPRIEKSSAVVRSLDGVSGFVIAGRGQGAARDRVIFQGAVHVEGVTYVASGTAQWKDRSEASMEFTRILRSLRPIGE